MIDICEVVAGNVGGCLIEVANWEDSRETEQSVNTRFRSF